MRRLIAPVLVALVVAGACGGDDDKESAEGSARASTTTAAPATTAGLPPSTPSTSPVPGATKPPVGARTGSTTTTATAGAASPAPASGLTFTAPGTYRYASTGRVTSTLTGSQPRNGETVLTVDPPTGADQHSVRQGGGRSTDQVLRLEGGNALLVSLRLSEQGLTKEFRPSPPGLAIPGDAAPGRTWSWQATSTDGKTNVDSSFRVVRTEDFAVGAEQVSAVVIELVVRLSGDVEFISRQTLWVSPRHGLVVRQDEATQGRFAALAFSGISSDKLLSLRPA